VWSHAKSVASRPYRGLGHLGLGTKSLHLGAASRLRRDPGLVREPGLGWMPGLEAAAAQVSFPASAGVLGCAVRAPQQGFADGDGCARTPTNHVADILDRLVIDPDDRPRE